MVLGLSLSTFTTVHVVISLIALGSGLVVLTGMLNAKRLPGWTLLFLLTILLTSVTGFLFPDIRVGPPFIFGVVTLVVLALAIPALYTFRLSRRWRITYVVGVVFVLYLDAVVAIVQGFQKLPVLNPLAPTQTNEPAFLAAQLVVLALFIWFGWMAVRRFHPAPVRP